MYYYFTFDYFQVDPHQIPTSVMRIDFLPPSYLKVDSWSLYFMLKIWTFGGNLSKTVENRLSVLVFEGADGILDLCGRSCRETGFTRGALAPLACPVSADSFLVSFLGFHCISHFILPFAPLDIPFASTTH